MAFRRRFGRRRGGFQRRAVARKEPIWISTAYFVTVAGNVGQQALFQLIGPEDYTPDYTAEISRKDKCTLVRTVGQFSQIPIVEDFSNAKNNVAWKAALFVAGDKQVDDAFSNDPGQFDITSPAVFPTFCRDYAPMHIFWDEWYVIANSIVGGSSTTFATNIWYPPTASGKREWDITVKRKMEGDDALFLLLNITFVQNPTGEIGGALDVESRNLIMDQ